jgi:DNA-binding PadR family transcriptional regulator
VADYPESTFAVLGLVDKLPDSSGYELTAVARLSLSYFWPVSQTLLYRELGRLADLGWVTRKRVEQVGPPDKWTFRTTAAGKKALVQWLADPVTDFGSFRSGFLLKLFFSYRMNPSELGAHLERYRQAIQSQLDQLQTTMDKLEALSTPEARAGWLTALHGLQTAQARLGWVDEVESLLKES